MKRRKTLFAPISESVFFVVSASVSAVSVLVVVVVVLRSFQYTVSSDEVHLTPDSSPELTKRSWFGNLMTTEKDETFTVLVKGKPLATVKAHLIHAFLSVNTRSFLSIFGRLAFD